MTPEDAINAHLDTIDAAADWTPVTAGWDGFPPSFDEWNALRMVRGERPGSFTEYMRDVAPMLARETESES